MCCCFAVYFPGFPLQLALCCSKKRLVFCHPMASSLTKNVSEIIIIDSNVNVSFHNESINTTIISEMLFKHLRVTFNLEFNENYVKKIIL